MVFSSTIFLFAFLPVTLAGYYLLNPKLKNYFLLAASLLFYAWGEPTFVFVMIGSILVNHVLAWQIDRCNTRARELGKASTAKSYQHKAKSCLVLMVVFNLSLFFVYKYLDFTITNINAVTSLFGARPIPLRNIALPIGISFFTFQAMSYVFDVYYGRGKVQKNPLNTMLYVALFPQLIAGPIVRYETVAEEITGRKETLEDFAQGIKRFIIGMGKKAILANTLAVIVDQAFGYTDYSQLTVLLAWFGAASYMLQVYFDFSGYSDMAIGLGLMFGFHFKENFNYPYISKTVGEFWRRWHISLGSWFRDYLFVPVSGAGWLRKLCARAKERWGSRGKEVVRTVVPLMVVWLCNGIWHGANWTYISFGCYYGVLLSLDAVFGPLLKKWTKKLGIDRKARWFRVFQTGRTLFLALLADVVFRSDSMGGAFRYLGSLFGLMGNSLFDGASTFLVGKGAVLFLLSAVLSMPVIPWLREKMSGQTGKRLAACSILSGAVYGAVFIVAVAFTVTSTYNPFIYFNF